MRIPAAIVATLLGVALIGLPASGAVAQQAKSDSSSASTTAPAAPAAKTKKSKSSTAKSGSKMSAGRQAAVERQRACGAEWKADKEAGKVAAGITWPKYWSACNKRKKAAGT